MIKFFKKNPYFAFVAALVLWMLISAALDELPRKFSREKQKKTTKKEVMLVLDGVTIPTWQKDALGNVNIKEKVITIILPEDFNKFNLALTDKDFKTIIGSTKESNDIPVKTVVFIHPFIDQTEQRTFDVYEKQTWPNTVYKDTQEQEQVKIDVYSANTWVYQVDTKDLRQWKYFDGKKAPLPSSLPKIVYGHNPSQLPGVSEDRVAKRVFPAIYKEIDDYAKGIKKTLTDKEANLVKLREQTDDFRKNGYRYLIATKPDGLDMLVGVSEWVNPENSVIFRDKRKLAGNDLSEKIKLSVTIGPNGRFTAIEPVSEKHDEFTILSVKAALMQWHFEKKDYPQPLEIELEFSYGSLARPILHDARSLYSIQ